MSLSLSALLAWSGAAAAAKPPHRVVSADLALLQQCDAGQHDACVRAASKLLATQGDADEAVAQAAELLSLACKRGSGDACYQLGHLGEEREKLLARRRAPERALPFILDISTTFRRGCELGSAEACLGAAHRAAEHDQLASMKLVLTRPVRGWPARKLAV